MATQPSLPSMTVNRKWASLNEVTNNVEMTLSVAQVVLTAAQLLALKTTPVSLVDAGVQIGEIIIVNAFSMTLNFGTTAYTLNAGNLKLFYGTTANALPITGDLSALLTNTSTKVIIGYPSVTTIGAASTILMCQVPIFLGNSGTANFTLGDSTLTVNVYYSKSTN